MNEELKRLEMLMKEVGTSHAEIGVLGGTHTDKESGKTFDMADLAIVHEFGRDDGHIQERSFLRSSLEENKKTYKKQLAFFLRQAFRGEISYSDVLEKLGAVAAGGAQKKILDGPFKPLKEATIKRKGSSKPLIDTGQLLQSITWDVKHD
jgi:hypothetical protein